MAEAAAALQSNEPSAPVVFECHPDRYRHWKLSFDGAVATLAMNVDEDGGIRAGYKLKLNSYDLGVDIELHDAVVEFAFAQLLTKLLSCAT